jgi:flagellar hook-associated protein 1 FlgK
MSLAYSIANALTGLQASSKAAEIVSNNVANAMTEGYARRELDLSARAFGGQGAGVSVDGVRRVVDEAVLRDRRLSDAAVGQSSVAAEFYSALERLIGTPEDAESLSANVNALETSLIEAASRPESEGRLQAIADAAVALTDHLNRASAGVQQLRMDAEGGISSQVNTLNASLKQVEDLNKQIVAATQSKQDPSALLDLRQQELDKISAIVPLNVVQRERGSVAVFTTNGERLLDGKRAVLSFEPTRFIDSGMTHAAGDLNGILVDGRAVSTDGPKSPLGGGSLGGLFELRDDLAVEAQAQLDVVARDMVERFSDPAVDTTLGPTDPGLFTDLGVAFDPADEVGLSARITVNTAVTGGELWRLRDGLGPTAVQDVGNATLLQGLADQLATKRPAAAGAIAGNRTAVEIASHVLSSVGVARQTSETTLAGATGQQTAFSSLQGADGVDSDAEMQKLMLIEQAYAANARVISVADELMQIILGL